MRNETITLTGDWTEITNADTDAVTFQNISNFTFELLATNGVTSPSESERGITYLPSYGAIGVSPSDLFPGVSGANRLWARSANNATIFVSHGDVG